MKISLNQTPTLFKPAAKAHAIAAKLAEGDDWIYKVEVYDSGWAVIHIFDEDGEFIASFSN